MLSLSSYEESGVGPNGWSKVVSSVMTWESALSRLYECGDLGLRKDSGVAGLPNEDIDRSSASSDGTLSLDVDRDCNNPFSVALPSGLKLGSSLLSQASSSSTLSPGLLLRLDVLQASSFFHSFTNSSMDMRRCSRLLRLNWFGRGGGMAVMASRAATEGDIASGSCASCGFLLPLPEVLRLRAGMVCMLLAVAGWLQGDAAGTGTGLEVGLIGSDSGGVR